MDEEAPVERLLWSLDIDPDGVMVNEPTRLPMRPSMLSPAQVQAIAQRNGERLTRSAQFERNLREQHRNRGRW